MIDTVFDTVQKQLNEVEGNETLDVRKESL